MFLKKKENTYFEIVTVSFMLHLLQKSLTELNCIRKTMITFLARVKKSNPVFLVFKNMAETKLNYDTLTLNKRAFLKMRNPKQNIFFW